MFVVLTLAGGCSFSGDAALEQAGDDSYGSGATTNGYPDTGDPDSGESSAEGTGDTGEEDEGGLDGGVEDPDPALELCDPFAEQVIAYGLEQANAEAAAVLVRESVLGSDGTVPAIPLSARPFLNHYEFDYPPADGWDLQVSGELWQPPMINADAPARYRLQYAVRGPEMGPAARLPVDLAIVVDLGAAMSGEPLALAEEALAAIESALIPGDRVTLIAAAAEPIPLGTTPIDSFGLSPLTGLIEQQEPAALADVGAALELAYDMLAPQEMGQGQPRVLLISNGHFDAATLAATVEAQAADGRYLLSVGVGDPKQYDDATLATLAREGLGSTLFARTGDELWIELSQRFTSHFIAAATDLEVTLTLPPGLAVRQRDPYSGAAGEPKLALLGPNDMLVFHHELEACAELSPDAMVRVQIEWTDPVGQQAKQVVWEHSVAELGEVSLVGIKGAATAAYARALRSFRDGYDAKQGYGAVLDAITYISDALAALPEDQDLIEMSSVVAALSG